MIAANRYTPLELTAVHAIACKSSANRRGYNDVSSAIAGTDGSIARPAVGSNAAASHTPKKNYQTPLLNRMYYYRSVAVKCILEQMFRSINLEQAHSAATNAVQLLVLGAGFELFDYLPGNVNVFLVDLPGITEARKAVEKSSVNVFFVAADLRDANGLFRNLHEVGFKSSNYSVVLLESVLSYIENRHVDSLLQSIRENILHSSVLIYDVTLPALCGGFSEYTEKNFKRGNAPLQSARASALEVSLNLRCNGWKHVCSCDIQHALDMFVASDKTRIPMILEPFDEFSALALLNAQYVVAWASNSSCLFEKIPVTLSDNTKEDDRSRNEITIQHRLIVLQARIDLFLGRLLSFELFKESEYLL